MANTTTIPAVSLAGGIGQLSGALVGAIGRFPGVEVRMKSPAVALDGRGGGFEVRLANGELLRPEAVVLASPGPVGAGLLDEIAPAAATHVRSILKYGPSCWRPDRRRGYRDWGSRQSWSSRQSRR